MMQGIISSVGSVYTVTNWASDEREITLSASNWVADSVGGGYQYQLRGADIGSGQYCSYNANEQLHEMIKLEEELGLNNPDAEFEILPSANTLAYLSDYNRVNAVFTGAETGDGADATKSAYYFYCRINNPRSIKFYIRCYI